MKYTFHFVDIHDNDMFDKNYEFNNIEEARRHATLLLANDMNNTHHIEITSEDYSVVRDRVNK